MEHIKFCFCSSFLAAVMNTRQCVGLIKLFCCCQVKLQMYREYFRTIGLTFIMTIIFLCAFQQAASLSYNYWLSLWADEPCINGTQSDQELKLSVFAALGFTQGRSKSCLSIKDTCVTILHSASLVPSFMYFPHAFRIYLIIPYTCIPDFSHCLWILGNGISCGLSWIEHICYRAPVTTSKIAEVLANSSGQCLFQKH